MCASRIAAQVCGAFLCTRKQVESQGTSTYLSIHLDTSDARIIPANRSTEILIDTHEVERAKVTVGATEFNQLNALNKQTAAALTKTKTTRIARETNQWQPNTQPTRDRKTKDGRKEEGMRPAQGMRLLISPIAMPE